MHNIENELPKERQPKTAAPLRDKLADAADLMILPVDGAMVVPRCFIPEALVRPVVSLVSPTKLIAQRAIAAAQLLHEFRSQRFDARSHWGLNE